MKTPENVALAKKMRADGISLWEIADHFHIHENTAGMWINEERADKHRQRRRADYQRQRANRNALGTLPTMTPDQARALIAQLAGQPVRTFVGIEPGNVCLGRLAGEMLDTNNGPRPLEAIILKRGCKREQFRQAIAVLST